MTRAVVCGLIVLIVATVVWAFYDLNRTLTRALRLPEEDPHA